MSQFILEYEYKVNKTMHLHINPNLGIFTARKRSLRRLCFYRCLSVHRGGLTQCMLGDSPGRPPAKETPQQGDTPARERPPSRERPPPPGPHPGGKLRGIRSRPTAKGKLRGIRSRPTPKGEIEGDQIQAHTQGGNSGGSDPGPHPRGKFRGIRTRPLLSNYCCRRYASYWNAFLCDLCFNSCIMLHY